ncbi:MAG: DUF202 domain-containing protein [Acidimicrobiales bacterium]
MSDVAPATGYRPDPSRAGERTELAWGRSVLSLLACGVAIGRGLPALTGNRGHPVAGAVVLAIGIVAWAVALPSARRRARAAHAGQRQVATGRDLLPLSLGTALVGLAALAVELFLPR